MRNNNKGFTLMEILGVVGVVLILSVLAIPGFKQFNSASKRGVAERNMSTLNDAVQQYDQVGGLMTAQVPMPLNVSGLPDAQLPEVQAVCLLANSDNVSGVNSGQFVASYQRPVISRNPNDFRVIWINGVTDANASNYVAYKSASGARNKAVEALISAGNGGHFVLIGPGITVPGVAADRPGIVSFSKDGVPCSPQTLLPSPQAKAGNIPVSLTVSPAGGGSVTGSGTYASGTDVNIGVTLAPGWKIQSWDSNMSALLGNYQAKSGKLKVTAPLTGTVYVEKGDFNINLSANPPTGGNVTGSGAYKIGDTVTYAATPQLGWKFNGWSVPALTAASGTLTNQQTDITAVAAFSRNMYNITIASGQGGTTNEAPGKYEHAPGDILPLAATPTYTDTWGQPRYRWDKWLITAAPVNTASAFTYTVAGDATITPVFVQQFKLTFSNSTPQFGTATSSLADGIYDIGTTVTFTATPNMGKYGIPLKVKNWWVNNGSGWVSQGSGTTFTTALTADTQVVAELTDKYTLTLNVTDQYGNPISSGFNLTGTTLGAVQYDIGQQVPVSVVLGGGWDMIGFTGVPYSDAMLSGGASATITMDADKVVNVTLRRILIYLSLSATDPSASLYGGGWYSYGDVANINVYSPGYNFQGWSDGGAVAHPVTMTGTYGSTISLYAYMSKKTYTVTYYVTGGAGMQDANTSLDAQLINYSTGQQYSTNVRVQNYDGWRGTYIQMTVSYGDLISANWQVATYANHLQFNGSGPTGNNYWGGGNNMQWWNAAGNAGQATAYGDMVFMISAGTPLVIDLNKDHKVGTLSGNSWKLEAPASTRDDDYRVYPLGDAFAKWEWLDGADGLLAYNPTHTQMTPDGTKLFGSRTFGKTWANGFEALATLDTNKDGKISGKELDDLYVWQDKNSNAIVDEGEMKPAAEYEIATIAIHPHLDKTNAFITEGVTMSNGEKIDMFDWWSKTRTRIDEKDMVSQFVWNNNPASEIQLPEDIKPLQLNQNGILTLYKTDGQYWMKVATEKPVMMAATVTDEGIYWGDQHIVTNRLMISGSELVGVTITANGYGATWRAENLAGKTLDALLKEEHDIRTNKK